VWCSTGCGVTGAADDLEESFVNTSKKAALVLASAGIAAGACAGTAAADSGAQGGAANSPGVISGNNVQVPVHVPVNVCGDTVDVIALLNPTFGNVCVND